MLDDQARFSQRAEAGTDQLGITPKSLLLTHGIADGNTIPAGVLHDNDSNISNVLFGVGSGELRATAGPGRRSTAPLRCYQYHHVGEKKSRKEASSVESLAIETASSRWRGRPPKVVILAHAVSIHRRHQAAGCRRAGNGRALRLFLLISCAWSSSVDICRLFLQR